MLEVRRRSETRTQLPSMPVYVLTDKKKQILGYATNISLSGMQITSHAMCEVGMILNLEFTLPGTEAAISCRVNIRWCQELSSSVNLVGLEFVEIFLDSAKKILGWISDK